MVADMHLSAISATGGTVQLAGIFSRRRGQAQALADRHGGTPVYSDFDDVVADPSIDFVILATPPDARRSFVDRLIASQIPILLEKPIERDFERAKEIVMACEAAKLPLGVILQHRMRPAAKALADHIQSGKLGDIATVDVRIPWWREQAYYDVPGRGTYARDGGGVMITQAIHTIDLMLTFCGPVSSVQAMTATSSLHRLEAEDFVAAALRFQSGATGALVASTTHYPGGPEEIVLNGTRASARLSGNELQVFFHEGETETFGAASGSGGGADPMAFTSDWHQEVIEDFARSICNERAPAIPGRAALPAHCLIDAIVRSARTGRRTDVDASDG